MTRIEHDREPVNAAGVMGFVPVLPRLTLRELAHVDAEGVIASQGLVARTPRRRRLAARRAALAQLHAWYRQLDTEEHTTLNTETERKLATKNVTGIMNVVHGIAPALPWHSASLAQAAALNPFMTAGYPAFDGPIIGRSVLTNNEWRFDAWQPYVTKVSTSVNGWVIGMMGSGKSMFLKLFAARETTSPWNRHIIIEGDPKGEWASVAEHIGGQVVSIGSGSYLNTLDPGPQPAGRSNADWRVDVLGMQGDALNAIASVLRGHGAGTLDAQEAALLNQALNYYFDQAQTPTISSMSDLLNSPWPQESHIPGLSSQQARETANRLILLFAPMIHGALSGAFERASTISVDPTSPIIVFDTGSATEENPQKKALYMAAMSATVERLCAQHDGLFRIVIAEEGHDLLSNPVLVKAWDRRIRLSGDLGVANFFLMHELGDLSAFGEEGSEQRNTIKGILTKSTVQIIYTQTSASFTTMQELLPDLTAREAANIETLPPYCALWRVGATVRDIVRPVLSNEAYEVFQTDKNRQG